MKDLERNQPAGDSIRFVAAPASQADAVDDTCPPRLTWRQAQMPWLARLSWMWLLIGCVLLLAAGIYIQPDPRGHGTHEQLGFAPCGFYLVSGYACPTCGATTAFAWMVHGHPWMAIKTQPFGALTAVAAVALLGMSIVGIVTAGVPAIRLSRRSSIGLALLFLAVFLGSWLYKVMAMAAG